MKQITPEVVLHVQTFLKNAGIFYGEPATDWSAQSLKALHEYRRRQGVRAPHNTMMPNSVEGLPEELQKYISDKEAADLIEVAGGEEDLADVVNPDAGITDSTGLNLTGAALGDAALDNLEKVAEAQTNPDNASDNAPSSVPVNAADIEIVTTPKVDQANASQADSAAEEKPQEETTQTKETTETKAPVAAPKATLPPLKHKRK